MSTKIPRFCEGNPPKITAFLLVVAIAAGLAFSQITGRHIRVGFLIDRLPKRGKIALELFSSVLGLGLFAVIGWVTYDYGLRLLSSGTETLLLGIGHYPFALWIAFCCIPMCCVILIDRHHNICLRSFFHPGLLYRYHAHPIAPRTFVLPIDSKIRLRRHLVWGSSGDALHDRDSHPTSGNQHLCHQGACRGGGFIEYDY